MDNMKKKRIKQYITWILLITLVAGLAVMPLLAAREEEASGPQASILSATAQLGNMEVTIKGGGTLSPGNAENVTIPKGVKITEFLVKNNDQVIAGTPVAKVDPVSVMNAIIQVKDSMDYIQEQITDAGNDAIDATIRAAAGGRIKQVFAQPGDSVQQVMLEHGALAVLSLDGMMGVSLTCKTSLGAGDPVCVKLEDGSEISGRVESNLNGTLAVTVVDNGYGVGEAVTVTAEEGELLGTGELYVHNAWRATGYTGTVQTVYAQTERTVSDGAALFLLKDTDFTGNLEAMSALHREYEELLQELFQMYESEVITAPCDGIVSGVEEDSAFLLAANKEKGWTVMWLGSTAEPVCDGTDTTGDSCKASSHKDGCIFYCTGRADCPMANNKKHKITCLSLCISAEEAGICRAVNHKQSCIESCSNEKETGKCQAHVHKAGCIESCVSTDGSQDCPASIHKAECLERCDKKETCTASTHHYPECLTLCTGNEDCPALNHKNDCYMTGLTYYAYAALVRQVGTTELIVAADPVTRYEIKTGTGGWTLVEPSSVNTELMIVEQTVPVASTEGFKPGDVVLIWTGYSAEEAVKTGVCVYIQQAASGTGGFSGFWGGMSGMGGMVFGGGGQSTETELYDLEGDVLMTVTDHSHMNLEITLDEQDIARVYLGQTAAVKITALKGEVFEAQVTDIGMEGVNNGGSSKFTVELTLPYREDMLPGMHATASITEYTKMDVLTLPVAALQEEPGRTLVCTALNPETGEPASPVEVTTGVSDGETVEIVSGLNRSDTVYYSYYDVLELDHTAKAENSPFG